HRKRMFLSMMTPERLEDMKRTVVEELDKKAQSWENKDRVIMLEEIQQVFGIAGMRWAGLPVDGEDVNKRVQELVDMVDFGGATLGKTGISFAEGMGSRKSHEKWLQKIIKKVRSGKLDRNRKRELKSLAIHLDVKATWLTCPL